MKRTLLLVLAIVALSFASATAQTATGTLNVSATINGTIGLVFNSDAAGPALSAGEGTNTATLPFGTVQAYGGTMPTGVLRTVSVANSNFTVTAPVDVNVFRCNSSSANYTLKAQLGTADTTNSWTIGGTPVTSGSQASITSTGTYAQTGSAQQIGITIPFSNNTGSISNSINFTATAN